VLGRRLLVLAVVLAGLTLLAAVVAPRPTEPEVVPRPPAIPAPAARAAEPERVVRETLSAELGAPDQRVRATVGDRIELLVEGKLLDAVVIPELDLVEAIDPETPARFELYADRAGTFPIALQEAGRPVGELEIEP
jgi:hypothetical protein